MRKMKQHINTLNDSVLRAVIDLTVSCQTRKEMHSAAMVVCELRDVIRGSELNQRTILPMTVAEILHKMRK